MGIHLKLCIRYWQGYTGTVYGIIFVYVLIKGDNFSMQIYLISLALINGIFNAWINWADNTRLGSADIYWSEPWEGIHLIQYQTSSILC